MRFLLFFLSAALLASLIFQHHRVDQLRAENAALFRETAERDQLQASFPEQSVSFTAQADETEIARLRDENRDLLKLRNEVRQMREHKAEFETLRAENERLRAQAKAVESTSHQKPYKPIHIAKENLSNQGFLTPEATVQTYFWARRVGDVQVLGSSLVPARWAALQQDLPGSAEFAKHITEDFAEIIAIEIVARRSLAPDVIQLGVQIRTARRVNKTTLMLRQFGIEWKLDVETLW
jgi:hypothetical protein